MTHAMPVAVESGWVKGTVKTMRHSRGYGFVTVGRHSGDLFLHITLAQKAGLSNIAAHDVIEIKYGYWKTQDGHLAGTVTAVRAAQ